MKFSVAGFEIRNEFQSEEKEVLELRAKINAISKAQAVIEFNMDGTIITANDNFLSTVGYSLAEIQGQHHSMFVESQYKASTEYRQFWEKLNNGEYESAEYKRIGKGGKEVWIQASYNPIIDLDGNPFKVVKYATDVTASKMASADFSGQISAIGKSQAVIEFNMDGTIITANENFLSTVGYSLAEIQGQHHSLFVESEYKESAEYQQFWKKLNRGEYESAEYKRIGKGGKEVWIQASYNPIMDLNGKPFKVVKYASDVTQSKMANADFSGQIDAIGKAQAVIEFNMDGSIIFANENFLATVGYSLAEIQGQHHSLFVEPQYKASAEYQQFWEKLNSGEYESAEYKRIGKGGKEIWIQASYNPIMDLNGKPFKVVKYATDITVQKNQAVENKKIANISSALKLCTANVMLADMNMEIVYINDQANKLMSDREREIKKALPRFQADKLLGENVDVFHKNANYQRGIIDKLSSSVTAEINLSNLTLGLTITPWHDVDGNRIGSVVEWNDRTEEVAIEKEIDDVVEAASQGNFTKTINLEGKDGFFKKLSEGLNRMVETTEVGLNDVIRVLGAMAKGDLNQRISRDYQGSFGQLKNDANITAEKLTDVIKGIKKAAISIGRGSQEIVIGNTDLSQRTEEQASSLEETASSMEEMTSTIRNSTENADLANKESQATADIAKQGGEVVQRAVIAMGEINKSSNQIADIIGVIDEIAFQTNLLALNAAVEAARAGEQGRGFAVVAGEVRNLAQRSATAAKEIKDLIRDSVEKVQDGTKLVNDSGDILQDIVVAVTKVSAMVDDINSSSREQASGIEMVNTAVTQMDEMTQKNAALVEESSAAGQGMSEQANEMNSMMSFFNIDSEAAS